MREIKVALVGCGFVANDHLRAWKKVREARVVAVSDLNENAVTKTAELWKIPHYYKSFSELIEQNEIDLVDICTPPQTHASLAVQAMKAGFHILLEKPMALDLKDAKKIAQCQKATGQKGGVIHNWLFEPTVLNATSLIEKGRLGEVISLEVEVLHTKYDHMVANEHHWCHGSQGGRFSEMLAHPIYLTRHFLGEVKIGDVRVSKIGGYAWMKSDELCATFKSGEKLGRIYISFNAPRDEIFIGLHGREAILQLNMINATTSLLPKREVSRFSKGFDALRQATQLLKSTTRNVAKIASGSWLSGHEMCIKLFTQSLIRDSEPPVTIEDGYRVVKVLEEICERIGIAEYTRIKPPIRQTDSGTH